MVPIGKELDHLIAVRVMGAIDRGNLKIEWRPMRAIVDPPAYSSSISAAWEVVEKLRSIPKPGDACLDFTLMQMDRLERGQWCVKTEPVEKTLNNNQVWIHADTAPHAICLAALKAMSHEI